MTIKDKKLDEGKPFKVAMIACVNKPFTLDFCLIKKQSNFPRYSIETISS